MTTAQERAELRSSENKAPHGPWLNGNSAILELLDDIDRLTAEVETLKSTARTDEILLGAAQDAAIRLAAQLEQYKADAALDKVSIFKAKHQFLEWNRQQDVSLVKIAYEYGVFEKAIELHFAAMKGQS